MRFQEFVLIAIFFFAVFGRSDDDLDWDNWWEIENGENDEIRTYLKFTDLDQTNVHSCYTYKLVDAGGVTLRMDTFCYPSIIVTGVRKCSTSALFNLIAQYPNMKHSQVKENCAFIGDRSIVQYFDSLPRSIEQGEIIIDGCVDLKGNMKLRSMLRNPNSFYLVLVRDYSDWIWSAYNYWCQPFYDKVDCSIYNHWVNPDVHIRSPEIFHDIVAGSINGTEVPSPLLFKQPCEKGATMYRQFIENLWKHVPVSNTLIIASEELDHTPEYVWYRVATEIGLNHKHPKLNEFQGVRYNTQVQKYSKGEDAVVAADHFKRGVYASSKFQPLLSATRHVLDQCWYDDCIWTSVVSGHNYEACHGGSSSPGDNSIGTSESGGSTALQTLPQTQQNPRQYHSSHGASTIDMIRTVMAYGVKMIEYVSRNYNQSQNPSAKRTAEHTTFLQVPKLTCGLLLNDTVHDPFTRHVRHHASEADSQGVLILTTSTIDAHYLETLLNHATGTHATLRITTNEKSNAYNDFDKCGETLLVTAHPSLLKMKRSSRGENRFLWKNVFWFQYCYHLKAFTKIVVVIRDSLTAVWSIYQKSRGFSTGVTNEAVIHFDWNDWEAAAVQLLSNGTISTTDSVFTLEQSTMIDAFDNKRILRMEDLLYTENRVKVLYQLLQFFYSKSVMQFLPPVTEATKKQLRCSFLLSLEASQVYDSDIQMISRSNIDMAYASDDLLCKVKAIYQNSPLQLSSINMPANLTCHNGISLRKDNSRTCKLRYDKRIYLPAAKHPPALLALPTMDAVNMRLLIEHATGYYTGAMETNKYLMDLFPAEEFCGQRMVTIFASAEDVTIKNTRSNAGVVSLTNMGKKKCMKGVIRGFARTMLLVRDPIVAIWNEAKRIAALPENVLNGTSFTKGTAISSSSHTQAIASDILRELFINVSVAYNTQHLHISHAYDRILVHNFDPENVLIISYESLLLTKNRIKTLQVLLDFVGYPGIANERLECAYAFVEATSTAKNTQHIVEFFSKNQELYCQLDRNIRKALNQEKFSFVRLLREITCVV